MLHVAQWKVPRLIFNVSKLIIITYVNRSNEQRTYSKSILFVVFYRNLLMTNQTQIYILLIIQRKEIPWIIFDKHLIFTNLNLIIIHHIVIIINNNHHHYLPIPLVELIFLRCPILKSLRIHPPICSMLHIIHRPRIHLLARKLNHPIIHPNRRSPLIIMMLWKIAKKHRSLFKHLSRKTLMILLDRQVGHLDLLLVTVAYCLSRSKKIVPSVRNILIDYRRFDI